MARSTLTDAIWYYNTKRGVGITSIHAFRHTFAKLYIKSNHRRI